MAKKMSRNETTGAFIKGLGSLVSFAHPVRRGDDIPSALKVHRSLASDWERIGADIKRVSGRERSGK